MDKTTIKAYLNDIERYMIQGRFIEAYKELKFLNKNIFAKGEQDE